MTLGEVVEAQERPQRQIASCRFGVQNGEIVHEFSFGTGDRQAATVWKFGVSFALCPVENMIARMIVEYDALSLREVLVG